MCLEQGVAGVRRRVVMCGVGTPEPSSQCWASFACVVSPLYKRHRPRRFLSPLGKERLRAPIIPEAYRNSGPGCAFLPVRLASFCESTGMTESAYQRGVFAALVQLHLPTLWRFIRRLVR